MVNIKQIFAFPIKLFNFIKSFIISKESQPIFENKIESTYNLTKKELEKSFKLHDEKLIMLAHELSSQEPINNDDYNPQTAYYQLIGNDGKIMCIPITDL
ncbi:MAG: hypothetical protein ACIPMY_06925 [Rickettsia endosymbiont of Pentastiridius leporinus]